MFPPTEIAKKYSSVPGPEKSIAQMPGTYGFFIQASEYSKTIAQPNYYHFDMW